MKKILIVDDELEMLESLEKILSHKNEFNITACSSSKEAINKIEKESFDLIITDLKLGDLTGIDILKTAKKFHPNTLVIILSGYGTIDSSVEAVKNGAFDFIEKPFSSGKLFETIERAFYSIESMELNKDNSVHDDTPFEGIIYRSESMQKVIEMIKKVSKGKINVMLFGESGTGKELVARAIHKLSHGEGRPFVPVNCGALPESLFESELFGYEKGAFTGALKTKPGLMEFANDGTFFFDEIGDLSLSLQVKLLRILEERKIRRIGGQKEIDIDVRIIAATNKNLENAVSQGLFREDLYYRLNACTIELPPLRERRDDIIPIINHFLNKISQKDGITSKVLTSEAAETLKNYTWPGNIRELQNVIQKIYYLCQSQVITIDDLPLPVNKNDAFIDKLTMDQNYKDAKNSVIEKFDVAYLTHHLKKNNGNISKTAQECGIDRRSIHRMLAKYEIVFKD
jgi:DNA-binding NtrC family response regulator